MSPLRRRIAADLAGVHLALNVFLATSLLWIVIRTWAGLNPIWAISATLIEMVPIPPSATICAGAMRLSWHLTGVGPVDTADVLEVPQLTMLTPQRRRALTEVAAVATLESRVIATKVSQVLPLLRGTEVLFRCGHTASQRPPPT